MEKRRRETDCGRQDSAFSPWPWYPGARRLHSRRSWLPACPPGADSGPCPCPPSFPGSGSAPAPQAAAEVTRSVAGFGRLGRASLWRRRLSGTGLPRCAPQSAASKAWLRGWVSGHGGLTRPPGSTGPCCSGQVSGAPPLLWGEHEEGTVDAERAVPGRPAAGGRLGFSGLSFPPFLSLLPFRNSFQTLFFSPSSFPFSPLFSFSPLFVSHIRPFGYPHLDITLCSRV